MTEKDAQQADRRLATLLRSGLTGFRQNAVASVLGAVPVFVIYGAFRIAAANALEAGQPVGSFVLDFLGLWLAGTASGPWHRTALAAVRGEAPLATWRSPFRGLGPMMGASFLFWAGVLLGIRYLFGLPSVFVVVWYGFYGFAAVDGAGSGLKALGRSIALGQGRRPAVAALAAALFVINALAFLPLGADAGVAWAIPATIVLLLVTTGISMFSGAHLYEALAKEET